MKANCSMYGGDTRGRRRSGLEEGEGHPGGFPGGGVVRGGLCFPKVATTMFLFNMLFATPSLRGGTYVCPFPLKLGRIL